MVRALVRIGLSISALATLGLIVVDTEMGGDHKRFLVKILLWGVVLVGAGAMIWAFRKLTMRHSGGRCPKCRNAVRPGHIFCEDHFKESLYQVRDRYAAR